MKGWDEEVFWSLLQIAHLLKDMGLPSDLAVESYKRAHAFRPHRVEPIYSLVDLYNKQGEHSKAYACLKAQKVIPKPFQKDMLFNSDWMEQYGLLFQLSICSYYLGHYQESLDACDQLLAIEDLPDDMRKLTLFNRTFPIEKLQAIAESEVKSKPAKKFWFF